MQLVCLICSPCTAAWGSPVPFQGNFSRASLLAVPITHCDQGQMLQHKEAESYSKCGFKQ